MLMTVKGAIDGESLGLTLVHEHLLVDFSSAEDQIEITNSIRSDIINTMLPYLLEIKNLGVKTFFECTPKYVGRDVKTLKILSELSSLNIVTNTGFYGAGNGKHVPKKYYGETAEKIAEMFIKEWKEGIEDTDIKPGFIKTAVNPGPLSDLDKKLIIATAITHLETGLTIACHTGEAVCAIEVTDIIKKVGIDLSSLIIVHADNIEDFDVHLMLLKRGIWLEYDSIGARPIDYHVRLIERVIKEGFEDRILLSHDAGWYAVGEKNGGRQKIRGYTDIFYKLIPELIKRNISQEIINEFLIENPKRAFEIRIRKK